MVSRWGVYSGWPATNGSLGPMARTVREAAQLLDVMVGYDPEDPITALGIGHVPPTYTAFLDAAGLKGARIGILRETMNRNSEPDSEDFKKVGQIFDRAVGELQDAGAIVVDPIVIPDLLPLLAKRSGVDDHGAFDVYFARGGNPPFKSREEMLASPDYSQVRGARGAATREARSEGYPPGYPEYLAAREELTINIAKVMADHNLDAIVHKTVEHQPTLIRDAGTGKGATSLNTYLVFVPAISVPAGFTSDNLPVGITFTGRAYTEGTMLKLAHAYEQSTRYRKPPSITPPLPSEP